MRTRGNLGGLHSGGLFPSAARAGRIGRAALWCAAAWLALGAPSLAQSRLEQLEEELKARLRAAGVGREAAPPVNPRAAAPNFGATDATAEAGYLGIVADDRNETRGVRVLEVYEGGPGAEAGLRKNDLLTALDGQVLSSMDQLTAAVEASVVGQQLTFELVRDGKAIQRLVTMGRRPAPAARRFDEFGRIPPDNRSPQDSGLEATRERKAMLGVRSQTVKEEDRTRLRLPSTMGALVVSVAPDTPAAEAGLAADDVIVAIDGYVVNRPSDLTDTIQRLGGGKDVLISYYRAGRFTRSRAMLAGAGGNPVAAAATPRGPNPNGVDELPMPLNPNRTEVNKPVNPAAPAAPANSATMNDPERIELLENLVSELLGRVETLEQELKAEREKNGTPSARPTPPAPPRGNAPAPGGGGAGGPDLSPAST